jgi:hypothetical protein
MANLVYLEGVATIARVRPSRRLVLLVADELGLSHRDTSAG